MRTSIIAGAALALCGAAAEARVTSKTAAGPGAAVRAAASFTAPKGWAAEEHANGADPVLSFRKGLDRISLRLFGAKGSAYGTPEAFLRGPAATTMGRPPKDAGAVVVAGKRRALYEHGYPVQLGDPHARSGPPELAVERFVLVPLADGRFLVAAHAFESPIPSLERTGEEAFAAFLKSLKPLKK